VVSPRLSIRRTRQNFFGVFNESHAKIHFSISGIFFSADTILEKISLKSLNHLNKKAAESGIIFSKMHFKDVRLHPIDTVTWRDFSAQGYRK